MGRAGVDQLSPPAPADERPAPAGTAVHLGVLGMYLALALWVTGPLWSALVESQAAVDGPVTFLANLKPSSVPGFVQGVDPGRWEIQAHWSLARSS